MLSIKTINKIVKINNIKIAKIIKVETAPVLPSSKVATKFGISATIPAKIINEIPFNTSLGNLLATTSKNCPQLLL